MPGFIPNSRGDFILDFIVVAMAIVIPILGFSIFQVKFKKNNSLHRIIQITLGVVLGVAVIAFELDMRINGWRHMAEPSPYFDTWVFPSLIIHLCFAIPSLVLWSYTIYMGLKHSIDRSVNPARYSHKKWGYLSSYFMLGTAVTGWIFYYLAFMA